MSYRFASFCVSPDKRLKQNGALIDTAIGNKQSSDLLAKIAWNMSEWCRRAQKPIDMRNFFWQRFRNTVLLFNRFFPQIVR